MKFSKYLILIFIFSFSFNSLNAQKKYNEFKSIYNSQVECLGTGTKGVYVFKTIIVQKKKRPDFEKLKKSAIFNKRSAFFFSNPEIFLKFCKNLINFVKFCKILQLFFGKPGR